MSFNHMQCLPSIGGIFEMIRYLSPHRITYLRSSAAFSTASGGDRLICETVSSHIRRITMNNPKKRNALSLSFMGELQAMLEGLRSEIESGRSEIRAVIVRSSSSTLSGGHDLQELERGSSDDRKAVFAQAVSLMDAVENLPVPVIVSIHGVAAAAGCQLVAASDIAVCSHGASFSTPGILAGLFCSTPGVAVARSVPRRVAMEMVLTGEPISAERALAYGLVNHVVPEAEVDILSEKIATKISNLSSSVIQFGKRVFIEQTRMPKHEAYAHASEAMVKNLEHGDCVEGVRAFLEKRKPHWRQ